ncbi:methyltransferase domain-containing protein [Georgenia sp. 10Sc9-8]|uniref:Trans-aconitate 2-methyltransferase n=1 Tax=Georgenia halotolerans TaxID=3028317 RepID=A0ABT5TXI8_9MICO|nr:methyltransferase domain-containing protein [Georgenia halotolerans]
MTWDPGTYSKFAGERSRPFLDLVQRVQACWARPDVAKEIVDLGCGTGERTAGLTDVWPQARVTGIDSSPEMLSRARSIMAGHSAGDRLRFELGDLQEWRSARPVDVLVTNAALQWVPGHGDLLPGLVDSLAPGGALGLQVPGNHAAPTHALMRETVTDGPWADRLAPVVRGDENGVAVHTPAEYADILFRAGCEYVDAWETTYLHVLDPEGEHGDDAVLAWVSGTALRPLLAALADEGQRQAFTDAYAARLRAAYPRHPYGTPLPFRRIFAVGRRRH